MIERPPLPTLQEAVDALRERLTAGRVRATGTAIGSGLTGRVTDLTPDELDILGEALSNPRKSARLADVWGRDELDAAGASEDDWALECEVAWCGLARGLDGEALPLTVERIMRSGPYRRKWDEARGAVSWLAQDVANAVATTRDRRKKYGAGPAPIVDEEDETVPDETPEQEVARLRRELAQARATIAVQQTTLRGERSQKESTLETIRAMFDMIAIPDAQLNARTKLVYLVTGREAASRNSRGVANLPNAAIAEGTGLGEDVVSEIMQDIQARERSPIARRITREWVTNGDGQQEPRSVAQVRITTDERTFVSMLRAAPTMGGPSEKAQQKKAKAKARAEQSVQARIEAAAQPWGHCSQCDNLEVAVTGACPDHLEVVGETIVRREAFEVLNPAFPDSGDRATPPTVSVVTKRPEMQDSGAVANGATGPGEYLIRRDPALPPVDADVTGTCRGCRRYTVWRCVDGVTSCTACRAVLHVKARPPEQPPLIPDDPPRPAANGHHPTVPGTFR